MTQEEFYLKAMLALASNPKYVEVKPFEDDPEKGETHVLNVNEIQMDAERLLDEAKDSWIEAFDKPDKGTNDHLQTIADALKGLDENGIVAYCHE